MSHAVDNASYDKIKILHELCSISWFIHQHAERDAQETGDTKWQAMLKELRSDLDKHIAAILEQHKHHECKQHKK